MGDLKNGHTGGREARSSEVSNTGVWLGGGRLCGRVRRYRQPLGAKTWTQVKEHVGLYESRDSKLPTAEQCSW